MSIKPVFFADRREIKQVWQKGRGKIDVSASQVEDMDAPLYAIPDTHRVVPVKPTPEMIAAALPSAMRESDEDKYRAIGMIICIWDEMLAAHAAMASQTERGEGK